MRADLLSLLVMVAIVAVATMIRGVHASSRPWTDMTISYNSAGSAPRPRAGHSITNVGPLVYVLGGRYSNAAQTMYSAGNCNGATWNGKFFLGVNPASGCVFDASAYVVQAPSDMSMLSYDMQGGVWSEVEVFSIPSNRAFHAAAAVNATLYMHGGNSIAGTATLSECYKVDLGASRKEWLSGWCTGGPTKRYGHSLTHVRGKLYMFGGATLGDVQTTAVSPQPLHTL